MISLLGRGFVLGVVAWLIIEMLEVLLATFTGVIATWLGNAIGIVGTASPFLVIGALKAARMKKQGRINV